jgi:ATP-dependent DNA helicase RecQ
MPTAREKMLQVSGVGEVKYSKYGDRFLALILKFVGEHPETEHTGSSSNSVSNRSASDSSVLGHKKKAQLKHGSAYKAWSEEEDDRLREEFRDSISTKKISEIHGRTSGAIRARLIKLGLIENK